MTRWLWLLVTLWASPVAAIQLLVSIEPLAMLAEPLLGPEDSVSVLLPPGQSPHHIALRASDLRALAKADLVLWIGPDLEQALNKSLAALPKAHAMVDVPGLSWPRDDHDDHGGRDPHVWLNPDNGRRIVQWLAAELVTLSPARRDAIFQRRDAYLARLDQLSAHIAAQLAPMTDVAFIAYHPAYGHWIQRFGMQQMDVVALTPEQKPGARHLMALQAQSQRASCLVTEAFYDNRSSVQLAAQLRLPLIVADPMGAHIAASPDRYESLLRRLADQFVLCSAEASDRT